MTARIGTSPLSRVFNRLPGRENDPRFQHALEQLPGAAFLITRREGAVLAVNSRATALTEWTRDELMARSFVELAAPGTAGTTLDPVYTIEPGRVKALTAVPLRTRSGRVASVDLRLSALPEGGETLVLILATPVEERLAQEREATQQSRALGAIDHLFQLFTAPSESSLEPALRLARGMLGADAAALYRLTEMAEMHLQYADGPAAGFPHALGPSEAQLLKMPFTWSSSQRTETFLTQSVRAAGWTHFMAHPVGSPPVIQGALVIAYRPGNPPGTQAPTLLGFGAQLIQQLMAQIARESRLASAQNLAIRLSNQLAAIHAQIEEGVVVLNRQGTIDEINSPATRMLGYRSEDVTGLLFTDVLVSDDALAEAIHTRLKGGPVTVLEGSLHRRSGEAFPVMARLQPLPPPECGCVVTLRDLSEARANEVRREHLDQLAYAGQATQSFAHEVRGPLNNIAVGVQYLAARFPADDAFQQTLGKIQAECNRLSMLMYDMLAWAKPIEPQLEPTDLAALLKRLLNRWSTKILQRNVRVNLTAIPCPSVSADPRLIEQVFVNLIDNALQAMPAGGHLAVNLQPLHRDPQGQVVEVKIGDSGTGISEEVRRRIFDPYFTTKPDGTGLGLAICKRLVTIHRGAISCDSFPNAGTIFTVTLPALASAEPDSPTRLETLS
jgi:two-component system, NtrC family, nitrogen regulation sensor histidine kinase GlnL